MTMEFNDGKKTGCTATIVRPWMAITAKHCGEKNAVVKVDVTSSEDTDQSKAHKVWKVVPHSSLDVQALYLDGTAPWDWFVEWGDGHEYDPDSGEPLQAWGFGLDTSNTDRGRLVMAEFPTTEPCPSDLVSYGGDFCFETTYSNNLCLAGFGRAYHSERST